jgi:acyl dehydratase
LSLDGHAPYRIDPDENRALCESIGIAPDPGGAAHPSYYYIATQVGMGLTVAELCAACDFDVAEGPMMATSGARFLQPLRTGQAYVVRGSVISLTRKASRKLGVMDLLEYRLSLILPNGETVLEVDNVWVLPRGAKP